MPWQPTTIRRADKAYRTATDTVRVTTDAGPGFLKALGNHGGPHLLAADWVGTHLAQWLGLPTFEVSLINVTVEDEIQFLNGQFAQPGPAFIAREQSGMVWGGRAGILDKLVNPEDIPRLVLFDTWTRNCDRYPPDLAMRKPNRNNVFLSNEDVPDGFFRLLAMDHTHCFNCGRDLNAHLADIDLVQDERLYGLFPEFLPFLPPHQAALDAATARLRTLGRQWVIDLASTIPAEWQVPNSGQDALVNLICNRAHYTADTFGPALAAHMN